MRTPRYCASEIEQDGMAATTVSAFLERGPLSVMDAAEFLRAKPTYALLVVLAASFSLVASSGPASSNPATANRLAHSVRSAQRERSAKAGAGAVPAVPQPFPADRADLRPAFTKTVPTSITDLRSMQEHVEALAARVSPAVVAVEIGSGSGSGVVVSADGLVLTAGHVCGAAGRDVIFTFPSGKTAHGKTVGADPENDTGLLRITDGGPWPHVEVGDLQQARVGDWVLALGHPGGFDLRRSLVVRLGRIIQFEPALQTDCTIAPGDSGGPLVDMHGRIIGIHSAISPSVADNFHVPITAFYDTWAVLVKKPGV